MVPPRALRVFLAEAGGTEVPEELASGFVGEAGEDISSMACFLRGQWSNGPVRRRLVSVVAVLVEVSSPCVAKRALDRRERVAPGCWGDSGATAGVMSGITGSCASASLTSAISS